MKFHAMLPVRDEADILPQSLEHLLTWADEVHVFDTGSSDDTWDILQDAARQDSRVRILGREAVFLSDRRVRGWMFHQARKRMRSGDWFLRVDADEFHHVSPRLFVETSMRAHETLAYHQYYNFVFRESDLAAWDAGKESLSDRTLPIEQRRRWFSPSSYSEPRLCRYREGMRWPPTVAFPFNAGYVAERRLPIRHYPHRDPVQLASRCRLRSIMMADPENRSGWTHPEAHEWSASDWKRFVVPDSSTDLVCWEPGTPLPEYRFTNHLAAPPKRLVQYLVHRFCLPVLDAMRPGWPESARMQPIPREINDQLQNPAPDSRGHRHSHS